MICGDIPFEKNEQICSAEIHFPTTHISPQCRDLIKQCLRLQPASRIQLEAILDHPWMSMEIPAITTTTAAAAALSLSENGSASTTQQQPKKHKRNNPHNLQQQSKKQQQQQQQQLGEEKAAKKGSDQHQHSWDCGNTGGGDSSSLAGTAAKPLLLSAEQEEEEKQRLTNANMELWHKSFYAEDADLKQEIGRGSDYREEKGEEEQKHYFEDINFNQHDSKHFCYYSYGSSESNNCNNFQATHEGNQGNGPFWREKK